ncbi:MAG: hypothetical protein Q4C77_03910 [Eubacteriales bacterium]|nr:hypothetical protein [Eubacteriales bacterium]
MAEKKIFTDENSKEEFKGLCMAILPHIKAIMRTMKEKGIEVSSGISLGADGYFNFYIHGSRWEMIKFKDEQTVAIRYGYTEEIEAPESQEVEYSKVTENLMEISMVFADLRAEHEELSDIDSITWKQEFVEWAKEFEKQHSEPECWENDDYIDSIEEFAEKKILGFVHPGMENRRAVS